MKVLVIGSDISTYAFLWKLSQSNRLTKLYTNFNKNDSAKYAEVIDIKSNEVIKLKDFALKENINFTIITDETPILQDIYGIFAANNLTIFSPMEESHKILTNKAFAKEIMQKYGIKTPPFKFFDNFHLALNYINKVNFPIAIKYNNTVNYTDSFICKSKEQAELKLEEIFSFINKGIIIEPYKSLNEFYLPIVTDGYEAIPMPSIKCYDGIVDGEKSSKTGAVSPVSNINYNLEGKIAHEVIFPFIDALKIEKLELNAILNFKMGLDDRNNLYLLDVNYGLSNVIAQTILPMLEDDLLNILYSTSIGALGDEYTSFNINDSYSVTATVFDSAQNISNDDETKEIKGYNLIDDDNLFLTPYNIKKNKYNEIVPAGERVFCLTATSSSLAKSHKYLYETIDSIEFKGMVFRKNIGNELIYN